MFEHNEQLEVKHQNSLATSPRETSPSPIMIKPVIPTLPLSQIHGNPKKPTKQEKESKEPSKGIKVQLLDKQ